MPILQRLTSRHETRKHPKEDVSTTRGGRNHRYNIILHNLSVHSYSEIILEQKIDLYSQLIHRNYLEKLSITGSIDNSQFYFRYQ